MEKVKPTGIQKLAWPLCKDDRNFVMYSLKRKCKSADFQKTDISGRRKPTPTRYPQTSTAQMPPHVYIIK